jgi:predicted metalloprotease
MRRFDTWRRAVAFGALLVPALAAAAPVTPVARTAPSDVTSVTAADVEASNQKVAMAYGSLVQMWGTAFADVGARFARPDIVRYRSAVRTPCGVMRSGNAGYCIGDNTIYYDDVFVAGQAKAAARQLGTDGDMAAVGVIAHEMGHAVAMQLGHMWRESYRNEAVADCLAGAFAKEADRKGEIEAGDVDEAFYGMASAGDPTPQLTGDNRVDRAILVRAARMGHGTEEQRVGNFRAGLEKGAGVCLAEFR